MADDSGKDSSPGATGGVSVGGDNAGIVNTGVFTGTVNLYQGGQPGQPIQFLPSLPGIFQPRLKEIEEVKQLLNGAGSNVSVITAVRGWPGVGKTTLLIELAHDNEIRAKFSDGLMWVSLGPNPDVDNLLLLCAERVGFNKNQFDGQRRDVIKGAIHNYLVDKKFLIIIDDAWDSVHVNPFLFGGGKCGTVVATRNRNVARAIAPDRIYPLDEMSEAEGMALLNRVASKVVKRHQEQCKQLIHSLGLLPLTIKIAGGLLNDTHDKGFNVPEFIEKLIADAAPLLNEALPDSDTDDTEVPNVYMLIEKSLNRLKDEWRPLYAMLSVFGAKPVNYDLDAIKAVWEVEDPKPIVGKLVDLGLLEPVGDGIPRYQMHALLVDHASHLPERTPEESETEIRPAYIRHADHYRNVLSALGSTYLEGNESIMKALWIFDNLEWPNIQRAQQWSERNWKKQDGSADLTVAEILADFPNAGADIMRLRLHSREAVVWHQSAIRVIEEIITAVSGEALHKAKERRGSLIGNLGNAYQSLGEYRKAIEYYEQALEISREISDRQLFGNNLSNLGTIYVFLGECNKAIEYQEQALKITRDIGDRRAEASILGNLGTTYISISKYRKAIEYHEQALKIAREIGDRSGEGHRLCGLGIVFKSLGEYRKAIEYYEQALEISREISDRHGEGCDLGNLGNAYQSLGEYRKAIEYHEKALKISREISDRGVECAALGNIGIAYNSLCEYPKAIEYHEMALKISRDIGDRQGEGIRLSNLGNTYQSLREYRKAIEYYEQALKISREIGDRQGEGNRCNNLAGALDKIGKTVEALEYAERAVDILESIESPHIKTAREFRDRLKNKFDE